LFPNFSISVPKSAGRPFFRVRTLKSKNRCRPCQFSLHKIHFQHQARDANSRILPCRPGDHFSFPRLLYFTYEVNMYSCANYPRGCRGRVNIPGGKCADCVSLNLRRPQSPFSSPFAQPREYRRALKTETSPEIQNKHEV